MGIQERDYMRRGPSAGKQADRGGGIRNLFQSGENPFAVWIFCGMVLLVSGGWFLMGQRWVLPPAQTIEESLAQIHARQAIAEARAGLADVLVLINWTCDDCQRLQAWRIITHPFLHFGITSTLMVGGGVLVFGLLLDGRFWGSARVGLLLVGATVAAVSIITLRGDLNFYHGGWAQSAAVSAAVLVQRPARMSGGWFAVIGALAYLALVSMGAQTFLTGEPVQYALIVGGGGLGLLVGLIGRIRSWDQS